MLWNKDFQLRYDNQYLQNNAVCFVVLTVIHLFNYNDPLENEA